LIIYYSQKEILTNSPNIFRAIEQLFHLYPLVKNSIAIFSSWSCKIFQNRV